MAQKANTVLPHDIMGANIEEAFEIAADSGSMPKDCMTLLGTGTIAHLDIAAGKIYKASHTSGNKQPKGIYHTQALTRTKNAVVQGMAMTTGIKAPNHKVFLDGTIIEKLSHKLSKVRLKHSGWTTLIKLSRLKVNRQMEIGIPICKLLDASFQLSWACATSTEHRRIHAAQDTTINTRYSAILEKRMHHNCMRNLLAYSQFHLLWAQTTAPYHK